MILVFLCGKTPFHDEKTPPRSGRLAYGIGRPGPGHETPLFRRHVPRRRIQYLYPDHAPQRIPLCVQGQTGTLHARQGARRAGGCDHPGHAQDLPGLYDYGILSAADRLGNPEEPVRFDEDENVRALWGAPDVCRAVLVAPGGEQPHCRPGARQLHICLQLSGPGRRDHPVPFQRRACPIILYGRVRNEAGQCRTINNFKDF